MGRRRRPAVFLDRDGTLNREVDYLADPARFELLPGVPEALTRLRDAGYALIVVTNQSGIARGKLTQITLEAIHARMRAELAAHGLTLDAIEHCPHHPTIGPPGLRGPCPCRKPKPGMLLRAAHKVGVDLERSWTVGDAARDLAAGAALGVPGVLVLTGKGHAELRRLEEAGVPVPHVADDLAGAAEAILSAAR